MSRAVDDGVRLTGTSSSGVAVVSHPDYVVYRTGANYYAYDSEHDSTTQDDEIADLFNNEVLNGLGAGGLVACKKAVYEVYDPINPIKDITIMGAAILNSGDNFDHGTVFHQAAALGTGIFATTSEADAAQVRGFRLTNLALWGDTTKATGSGIFGNFADGTIDNCWVGYFPEYDIELCNSSQFCQKILHNRFGSSTLGCIYLGQIGAEYGGSDFFISDNSISGYNGGAAHGCGCDGVILTGGATMGRIMDNHFAYNIRAIDMTSARNNIEIIGNEIETWDDAGIYGSSGMYGCGIHNNTINANNVSGGPSLNYGIYIAGYDDDTHLYNISITGNYLNTTSAQYGIYENYGKQITIANNNINGAVVAPISINNSTVEIRVNHNTGYITENSGASAVADGQTHVHVTHGCAYTPTAGDITVTPTAKSTTDPTFYWWVDGISATEFIVNIAVDPDAATFPFGWRVMRT